MTIEPRNFKLPLSAALLAMIACSLPFLDKAPAPTESTPASTTAEPSPDAPEGTEFNPFLPTATPTVDLEAMQEAFHATGTITATFNGEPKEWQTGSVDAEGGPLSLSDWYRAPLQTISDLYEFEIYAVNPQSMAEQAVAGAAATSVEALTFGFAVQSPTAGQTLTFLLPAGDGLTSAEVAYLVPEGDLISHYLMTSGELTLNLLQVQPGRPASLQGAFSGTMTYAGLLGDPDGELDPDRTIEVSGGQVDLESVPYDPIFD